MQGNAGRFSLYLPLVVALAWSPAASAVTIDWTFVGDPGNACDPQSTGLLRRASATPTASGSTRSRTSSTRSSWMRRRLRDPLLPSTTRAWAPTQPSGGITRSRLGRQLHLRGEGPRLRGQAGGLRFVLRRAAFRQLAAQRTGDRRHRDRRLYDHRHDGRSRTTRASRASGKLTVFLPSENEWYKAAYYDPALSRVLRVLGWHR